jgi:hypothetical protein
MDSNNTQPVEQVNNTTPSYQSSPTSEKKIGPIVGILVLVLVLVAAAIYLFGNRATSDVAAPEDTSAASTEVQPVTNNSDEVNDLETDLNASVYGLDDQNF